MNRLKPCLALLTVAVVGTLAGCSRWTTRSADVSTGLRASLDQTSGKEAREARNVNSDLDKDIEGTLDAALLRSRLHKIVNYAVNNQVVVLTGEVDSQWKRAEAQQIAWSVPNVHQVVNVLQIKEQKIAAAN